MTEFVRFVVEVANGAGTPWVVLTATIALSLLVALAGLFGAKQRFAGWGVTAASMWLYSLLLIVQMEYPQFIPPPRWLSVTVLFIVPVALLSRLGALPTKSRVGRWAAATVDSVGIIVVVGLYIARSKKIEELHDYYESGMQTEVATVTGMEVHYIGEYAFAATACLLCFWWVAALSSLLTFVVQRRSLTPGPSD